MTIKDGQNATKRAKAHPLSAHGPGAARVHPALLRQRICSHGGFQWPVRAWSRRPTGIRKPSAARVSTDGYGAKGTCLRPDRRTRTESIWIVARVMKSEIVEARQGEFPRAWVEFVGTREAAVDRMCEPRDRARDHLRHGDCGHPGAQRRRATQARRLRATQARRPRASGHSDGGRSGARRTAGLRRHGDGGRRRSRGDLRWGTMGGTLRLQTTSVRTATASQTWPTWCATGDEEGRYAGDQARRPRATSRPVGDCGHRQGSTPTSPASAGLFARSRGGTLRWQATRPPRGRYVSLHGIDARRSWTLVRRIGPFANDTGR